MKILKAISTLCFIFIKKKFTLNSLFIKRNRLATFVFVRRIFIEQLKHTEIQAARFIENQKICVSLMCRTNYIKKIKHKTKIEIYFFIF
jgi:hypothetical protein